MAAMTVPQFSRPGAIDLSALRKPATPPPGARAGSPGGGRYDFDVVGEQALRTDVVERSMSVVVVVSFWSAASPASVEINQTLTALSAEFGGRFLFARLDVGAQPELAKALGIPEVPLVVAALRGQLAPLIQESLPLADMRALLDQVLQAAVANGVAGVAEPVAPSDDAAGPEDADEPLSRFPEAEEALLTGDVDAAVEAYRAAVTASPGDAEAAVGLARAELLQRTQGVSPADARAAAEADPSDVAAQTLAADLDLLADRVDDAFARLIDLVRRTSDTDRETARRHLIELFAVVGDADPRVLRGRQNLASALF
jgi:putative thioredoxin